VFHFSTGNFLEIGYILVPSERGKGYGSEAVKIIVDYLFLSRELVRVQAITDVDNFASQRVLEKAGFKKKRMLRKRVSSEENGETVVCSAFFEKNGKDQKY